MTADLKRYEKFGWDYELISPLTQEEVAWHARWARRTGGPVLGLACGTARLLCRLAEDGFETVGLDLCEPMLELARRHVAALPAAARARVELVRGNMCDFDLARTFGLVIVADNSLRSDKSSARLLACLRCIRRHLAPSGVCLITERRFDPGLYPDNRRVIDWDDGRLHPGTHDRVYRRIELELSGDHRRIRGLMRYKTVHADGSETLDDCPFEAPLLRPGEYVSLFARAGLDTRVCVGYRERNDDGRDPLLCFVCRPSA